MKKRLRKKKHRGEFREFGFGIAWNFARVLGAPDRDLFFDALLDIVAARGLTFGGGGGAEQGSGFLCKARRDSPSEEDHSQVAEWLRDLAPSVSATVGPFEDAWHGPPQVTSVREWIARGGEVIILPPVRR